MRIVIAKIRRKEKIVLEASDVINIIIAFLTFVSVVIVALTLHEMKVERNATYKPRILLNPTEVSFEWDSDGKEERTNISEATSSNFEIDDNDNINGSISIPISYLSDYKSETFNAVNLGVGNARDVVFEWHEENMSTLNEFLIECDPTKKDFLKIDKSAVFDINGSVIMTELPIKSRIMYMLADAKETYKFSLPISYSILIHEIIKANPQNRELPSLLLSAKYFDIQGKEHTDIFLIQINILYFTLDETGAGKAIYQLVPAISQS